MTIRLFYCSQLNHTSNQSNACQSNMFDIYDSLLFSSLWRKSRNSQWQRADREGTRCSVLFQKVPFTAPVTSSAGISSIFLLIISKHNVNQSRQLTLIVLYVCFSTKVTFDHTRICEISCLWIRHFRIVTTSSRCVISSSGLILWCVWRITLLEQNCLQLSSCLWSVSHVLRNGLKGFSLNNKSYIGHNSVHAKRTLLIINTLDSLALFIRKNHQTITFKNASWPKN